MPPRAKVVVIGSSNTDLVVRGSHLPTAGETVLGGDLRHFHGGKGANQAVAAARLGAEVTFMTCLGCDANGERTLADLARAGINTSLIQYTDQAPSGAALIMLDARGQNQIMVAPGANAHLLPEHLILARDTIAAADVLLLQLEIPLPTVMRAVAMAHDLGVPVMLNCAPVTQLPSELLHGLGFLIPNESEARFLLGEAQHTPADEFDGPAAARRLRELGPEVVIVTLGARGAVAASREGVLLSPGRRVDAVDSTAAGDCFTGALACAFAEGQAVPAMLRFANAAAALSVTRHGAQDSMPTRAELDTFASLHPL